MNKARDTLFPLCAEAKFFFAEQRGSHVPTHSVVSFHSICGVNEYFFVQQRVSRVQFFLPAKWTVYIIVRLTCAAKVRFQQKMFCLLVYFPKITLSTEPEHTLPSVT